MNVHSINSHCGDLQWAAQALYRMPGNHILRCHQDYIIPLRELVAGTNVSIEDCSVIPVNSYDGWVASGLFEHRGIRYQDNVDILGFVQKYFNALAEEGGFPPCFPTRENMVCAWPSIQAYNWGKDYFCGILFVNADPKSGQCPGYSSSEMDFLIRAAESVGHSVCVIEKAQLTLPQIGALSIHAKLIVGCATGPWWPTANKWNTDTQRICMLDPMRLDYGSSCPMVYAKNALEVGKIMEGMGYL